DPSLDRAQEVGPIDRGAAREGQGESLAGRRLQGAEDITRRAAPAVINLLLGPFGLRAGWPHEPLAPIALAGLRPHLVGTDDDAAGRWSRVELLDRPLLRAKSGSTRSPNPWLVLRATFMAPLEALLNEDLADPAAAHGDALLAQPGGQAIQGPA